MTTFSTFCQHLSCPRAMQGETPSGYLIVLHSHAEDPRRLCAEARYFFTGSLGLGQCRAAAHDLLTIRAQVMCRCHPRTSDDVQSSLGLQSGSGGPPRSPRLLRLHAWYASNYPLERNVEVPGLPTRTYQFCSFSSLFVIICSLGSAELSPSRRSERPTYRPASGPGGGRPPRGGRGL